jgi:protein associated with RNAse G/E
VTDISVGETVHVRYGKWGGGRHYEFTMSRLGEDEHGVWLGAPQGTTIRRPGSVFPSTTEWVTCFARSAGWTASFYPHERHDIATYVDITTVPQWLRDGALDVVSMVDLDLDVVLGVDGSLLIDDEDEFEQHRHSLAYPVEIVALAQSATAAVYDAIAAGDEPYRAVGQRWLESYAARLTTDP